MIRLTTFRYCCLFLSIVLILITQGCFEYDEQIIMEENGSGKLYIHYETERDMKFQNLYFPVNMYDIEYNIKENYIMSGIENESRKMLQKDDRTHVYMDFKFGKLDLLNSVPRFQNEEFRRTQKDNKITLHRFIYMDESDLDRTRVLFKSGIKSLFNRSVFEEIQFRFEWIVPGKIIQTNANVLLDENKALWTITLAEILKNRTTQFYLTYKGTRQ